MSDDTAKLWIGSALTPYGNEYGMVAVVAKTKQEAIAKARRELSEGSTYVPYQRYADALLDNLDNMREVEDGIVIDWEAARPHKPRLYTGSLA